MYSIGITFKEPTRISLNDFKSLAYDIIGSSDTLKLINAKHTIRYNKIEFGESPSLSIGSMIKNRFGLCIDYNTNNHKEFIGIADRCSDIVRSTFNIPIIKKGFVQYIQLPDNFYIKNYQMTGIESILAPDLPVVGGEYTTKFVNPRAYKLPELNLCITINFSGTSILKLDINNRIAEDSDKLNMYRLVNYSNEFISAFNNINGESV